MALRAVAKVVERGARDCRPAGAARQRSASPPAAPQAAAATDEQRGRNPIQPQADVDKAVDDITKRPSRPMKLQPTVAAKPRPTIRHSPTRGGTAPPAPTSTDTEDLYDTR